MAACRDGAADDETSDSVLARDLTLANAIATSAPELKDEPEAPRQPVPTEREERPAPAARPPVRRPTQPVRREPAAQREPEPEPTPSPVVEAPASTPEPAPEPAAPAPTAGVFAAGTTIGLSLGDRACSDANRPGDKMVAYTAQPVTAANGRVFPAGSTVVLEVASVERGANADTARITFRVKSITTNGETHPIAGEVIPTGTLERRRVESGGSDKKKVVGGAILGAIVGRVAGGDTRGAVVGAAAGAAVGAAAAGATSRYETCVPSGAPLRLVIADINASGY